MRRPLIAALIAAACLAPLAHGAEPAGVAALPAGHYVLDRKHSSLMAKVMHLNASWYAMRFNTLDASFDYDPAHPEATRLAASVDVTSLDVGADYSRKFANDFLDAAKNPSASFVSTGVQPGADGRSATVTGDLTLRGVTRPLTLTVTFDGYSHSLLFGRAAGFTAVGEIRRSDFGSRNLLSYVGDEVKLEIEGAFEPR